MSGYSMRVLFDPSAAPVMASYPDFHRFGHASIQLIAPTDAQNEVKVYGFYSQGDGTTITGDSYWVQDDSVKLVKENVQASEFISITEEEYLAAVEFITELTAYRESRVSTRYYGVLEVNGQINCAGFVEQILKITGHFSGISSVFPDEIFSAISLTPNPTVASAEDGDWGAISVGGVLSDTLLGDGGNDLLYGSLGADTLNGGDGDDVIVGGFGNDILNGNAGADYLAGGEGADTYSTDNNGDLIYERIDQGIDTAIIADGAFKDTMYILPAHVENGVIANDVGEGRTLYGNNLSNILTNSTSLFQIVNGNSGADIIYGGSGGDLLLGGVDEDIDRLLGGLGEDTLKAQGSGNDELWGGSDQDWLHGSTGDNVFHYTLNDGTDNVWTNGGMDVLSFEAISSEKMLTVSKSGSDIIISLSATDAVTIHDWFNSSDAQLSIKLPNGKLLSAENINSHFTAVEFGWEYGVYNTKSTAFSSAIRANHENFYLLDQKYQQKYGKSFFASKFNEGVVNARATGYVIDDAPVYRWAAGIGNSDTGRSLYGDAYWYFWSDGTGGINYVFNELEAGVITNGESYAAGGISAVTYQPFAAQAPTFSVHNAIRPYFYEFDSYTMTMDTGYRTSGTYQGDTQFFATYGRASATEQWASTDSDAFVAHSMEVLLVGNSEYYVI